VANAEAIKDLENLFMFSRSVGEASFQNKHSKCGLIGKHNLQNLANYRKTPDSPDLTHLISSHWRL
jgi:hypothetical protein